MPDTAEPLEPQDLTAAETANRLFFRLYQCANMMHKTGTRAVEEHGATTQQWAVLGALSHDSAEAGMTVGELAAFLLVSRQNLTGLLSRLEKQGLTERSRDSADGRSRRIKLSAKGRTLWRDQLVPEIVAYYNEALAGIPEGEQARFLTLLGQLLDNLKALDERP